MLTPSSCRRLVIPMALALAAGTVSPVLGQVQWRSPDAPAFVPDADMGGVVSKAAPEGGAVHIAVQLRGPVTDAVRATLQANGVRLGAPLGGGALGDRNRHAERDQREHHDDHDGADEARFGV
jgi:hypothetical protein